MNHGALGALCFAAAMTLIRSRFGWRAAFAVMLLLLAIALISCSVLDQAISPSGQSWEKTSGYDPKDH